MNRKTNLPSDLSPLELYSIAIRAEVEARDIYERVASKIENESLKSKIQFLRDEEENHRRSLEELYTQKFPDVELALPDSSFLQDCSEPFRRIVKPVIAKRKRTKMYGNTHPGTKDFVSVDGIGRRKVVGLHKPSGQKRTDGQQRQAQAGKAIGYPGKMRTKACICGKENRAGRSVNNKTAPQRSTVIEKPAA